MFWWLVWRRLRSELALEARRAGDAGPEAPPAAGSFASRWWLGRVRAQPVALMGRFRLRYRGTLVVGRYDWDQRLRLERPGRSRKQGLRRTIGSDRAAGPMVEPVEQCVAELSPAVRVLEVGPSGLRCPDYGPATQDQLRADLVLLADLATRLAGLPDPPLLAAVTTRDLVAVRERLAAGDDPNRAGPRDCQLPPLGRRPETPVVVAVAEGDGELLDLLLESWPLEPNEAGSILAASVCRDDPAVLAVLLARARSSLRQWDLDGALGVAAGRHHLAAAQLLLAAGADPGRVDLPPAAEAAELHRLLEAARSERALAAGVTAAAASAERGPRAAVRRWYESLLAVRPAFIGRGRRAWRAAARELGLPWASGSGPGRLVGTLDGLPARVEAVGAGWGRATSITIEGVPEWLSLRRESVREKLGLTGERFMTPTAASQWARTNDVLTRDAAFDERIDVKGPVVECLALLSRQLRTQVLDGVDRLGAVVSDGRVNLLVRGVVTDAQRLIRLVLAVRQLARAITDRAARDLQECLAEVATTDPSEYVRSAALGALGERFPGSAETLEASRVAARTARYDWYRMQAAANLGDEGLAIYHAVLADTTQRPEVRGMALRHIGWREGPEAEPLVLSHLDAPEPEIVLHAVRILGERAGTARSVEPLQRLAGPVPVGEVRRVAAAAVEAIQSRLAHAAPGQLSLAETGSEGRLSLSGSGQAGELTLAADDEGGAVS